MAVLTLIVLWVSGQLLTSSDLKDFPSPEADARIAYGEDPLQFGELRLPEGEGPHPVVAVVHGGFWLAEYGIDHIRFFADSLTKSGVATWTIEYRRVGDDGGGWPGTFLDVAAATDYLRTLASSYPLDMERVIAVGHSAGGHLVLWLAARTKLSADSELYTQRPLELAGVISLAGVDDLKRAVAESVCDNAAARLLGGTPAEFPERYAEASPIELLPLTVPIHLVNGVEDVIVPVDFGRSFDAAARMSGSESQLTLIDEAGHFELIAPDTRAWAIVRDAVQDMLR